MNALADVVDVAALVFERLPLRDRVRCLGVCRAWRAILLDAQHALFASLSLARTSGGALSACGALWAPLTRDLSLDRFRGWRRRRRQRALPSAADDDDDDESDVDAAALDVRALCGLRALRTLVLTSGRGLTSAVVRRVLRALPALASLDLSFSAGIDDALFDGGGALSTSLRELRMRHLVLVSVPLVRVLQALPSLALLDAAHCVQLDRTARDTDDAATRAQAWYARVRCTRGVRARLTVASRAGRRCTRCASRTRRCRTPRWRPCVHARRR